MSQIQIPNIRIGTDVQMKASLTDSGVQVDWSTLDNIAAYIYSGSQRVIAGKCSGIQVDPEDNTALLVEYPYTENQYLGVQSLVIVADYLGQHCTFDKPAFAFVATTEGTSGTTSVEDDAVAVDITVEDVDSSILSAAIRAALEAADLANEKAEYADDQGDFAKGQGEYAKDQGDYAKAQGDYAKNQIDEAKGEYESLDGRFDAMEETIPNDIIRTASDASFVHHTSARNTQLFYLREATTLLAGLMTASDKIKLSDLPTAEELSAAILAITNLIPAQASAENQLADKAFVNSSISTATATFRGTFNLVNDLHLTISASQADIAAALASAISGADNNDYSFVQIPTKNTKPNEIARIDRYKYNGTAWSFEYSLNNSSFTEAQWAALNSGITSAGVTKLSALPTMSELETLLGAKVNVSDIVDNLLSNDNTKPLAAKQGKVLDDKVSQLGQELGYFVCTTIKTTAQKTISVPGYSLKTGGAIKVKFTKTNTADSPTLNIQSTGAKPIYYNGSPASSINSWGANEVVLVYYDGTNYQLYPLYSGARLFDDTESNSLISVFFKSIKIYGVPVTRRAIIRDVWKNNDNDGTYRIFVYDLAGNSLKIYSSTAQESHIEADLNGGGRIVMDVDWGVIPEGYFGTESSRNIISLRCYENYLPGLIDAANARINSVEDSIGDLTGVKNMAIPLKITMADLTQNGYYNSDGAFVSNTNLRSKKIQLPENADMLYYSSSRYYAGYQSIEFFAGDELLAQVAIQQTGNGVYAIPGNATHVAVSMLKTETFVGYVAIAGSIDDVITDFSDTESSLRDALWAQDIKNPFAWKPFTKSHVTFMNDGCKNDVNSFRLACEKYGVPYVNTYQTSRLAANISFSDYDANAVYFGKNIIAGQEYIVTIADVTFTKLRMYVDCRCPLMGQTANVTIKYYTDDTTHNDETATFTIAAGKQYVNLSALTGVVKVGIVVTCGTELKLPLVNFCLTLYDNSQVTKTGAEIGKLIDMNFGEVMQHGDWLFNTLDEEVAYKEFLKQSYVYKKRMEDAIGVNIRGIIARGGPNSDRWQHTDMGQKFMVRNYLYSNWFGTSPQYSIPRSGAYVISGQVLTFTSEASLTINQTYSIDVGNNKKDTIVILQANGNSYVAAKRTNTNDYQIVTSGNIYSGTTTIGTFSNCTFADDATTGYWYVEQNKANIADAIANNRWLIFWCHSEIKAACYEAMCKYISELPEYGIGIQFTDFAGMYDLYKSSSFLESSE